MLSSVSRGGDWFAGHSLLHFVRVVTAQVFADRQGSGCSFAGSADQLFGAARAHIAGCEDALCAGLEVDASHDKVLLIQLDDLFEGLAIGRQADENEDAGYV